MMYMYSRTCAISGWMAIEHNLSGLSLVLYAILFSTTQYCQSDVVDYDFIKLCTGMTPDDCEPILQSFVERGLIEYDGEYYSMIDKKNGKV